MLMAGMLTYAAEKQFILTSELLEEIKKHDEYKGKVRNKVEYFYCSDSKKENIESISKKADIIILAVIDSIKKIDKTTKKDAFSEEHHIYFRAVKKWKGNPSSPIFMVFSTGVSSFDFTARKGETYLLFLTGNKSFGSKGKYISVCNAPLDALADEERTTLLNDIFK